MTGTAGILYARHDGTNGLVIGLDQGKPMSRLPSMVPKPGARLRM